LERSVPAERERKDTEGRPSCQPLFQSFFGQFGFTVRLAAIPMPHRGLVFSHKPGDSNELRRTLALLAENDRNWPIHRQLAREDAKLQAAPSRRRFGEFDETTLPGVRSALIR
jgi:hypothetical protein